MQIQNRKHHRHHKKRDGHRGSELVQNGKQATDEESLAEQKTMDLVKEELENSLDKKEESGSDDESENQPKPIGEVIKEKEMEEKAKAEESEKQ